MSTSLPNFCHVSAILAEVPSGQISDCWAALGPHLGTILAHRGAGFGVGRLGHARRGGRRSGAALAYGAGRANLVQAWQRVVNGKARQAGVMKASARCCDLVGFFSADRGCVGKNTTPGRPKPSRYRLRVVRLVGDRQVSFPAEFAPPGDPADRVTPRPTPRRRECGRHVQADEALVVTPRGLAAL